MVLGEVGLESVEADVVPVDALVVELRTDASAYDELVDFRNTYRALRAASIHESLHPLEAVRAGGHGGRAALVTGVAVGLDVLLPEARSPGGVHVGLAFLVGPKYR